MCLQLIDEISVSDLENQSLAQRFLQIFLKIAYYLKHSKKVNTHFDLVSVHGSICDEDPCLLNPLWLVHANLLI